MERLWGKCTVSRAGEDRSNGDGIKFHTDHLDGNIECSLRPECNKSATWSCLKMAWLGPWIAESLEVKLDFARPKVRRVLA